MNVVINETSSIIQNVSDPNLIYATWGLVAVSILSTFVVWMRTAQSNKITKESNEHLEKQLLTSNFEIITQYIGNPLTKECRGIIHNSNELLERLANEETYVKIIDIPLIRYNIVYNTEHFLEETKSDTKLRMLLESIRYVSSIYDRVGFLVENNPKLKAKFIPYHGNATLKIWNKISKIIELENKYNENNKKYPKFEDLVKWCGC